MPEATFLTPVQRGHEDELRSLLRDLRRDPKADPAPRRSVVCRSPFRGLGQGTHFARFVVIDAPKPHLLFTTRFDGAADEYFAALAQVQKAREIWTHCRRPARRNGAAGITEESLRHYLTHRPNPDFVDASYVVDLFGSTATVRDIRAALDLRAQFAQFVMAAQHLDPVTLAHSFRELEFVRELARP